MTHPQPLPSVLLHRANAHLTRAVQGALRGSGVGVGRWRVLDLLAEYPTGLTMSEISVAVAATGPTLTRIVDDLATNALVHREADVHDRRRVLVHLSPRGRRLRDSLADGVAAAEEEALGALADDDRLRLAQMLVRVLGHAGATSVASVTS